MKAARLAVALVVFAFGTVLPISAHPLGNFTINHLSTLTVRASRLDVRYVLDMAEIPTYQVLRARSIAAKIDRVQLAIWAQNEAASLLPDLHVSLAGSAQRLILDRARAVTRPGAGGLPTLYLSVAAHAVWHEPAAARDIVYRDATFAGRLGWRDVTVAPTLEPTHKLTTYPKALTNSARDTTAVSIHMDRSGHTVVHDVSGVDTIRYAAPASQLRSNQLSDMLARGTNDWGFVLLTLAVAIGLGALHALEPGHGKTLLAISLVGARATIKQATVLGAALTVAHTAGVLALAVAITTFQGYFLPEAIYPWITLGSGVAIAIIGARAIRRERQRRRVHLHASDHRSPGRHMHAGHSHDSINDHHDHDHDDIMHARSHASGGNAPLMFGPTVWAAMSGGIAPCPAALVVLIAAIAIHQIVYGIGVIVAFSCGLAATLIGIGIGVVRGARWLQTQPKFALLTLHSRSVSAVVISAIGALMVGQGFAQQGVPVSPILVAAITAAAIAGYACSHPFDHQHDSATRTAADGAAMT